MTMLCCLMPDVASLNLRERELNYIQIFARIFQERISVSDLKFFFLLRNFFFWNSIDDEKGFLIIDFEEILCTLFMTHESWGTMKSCHRNFFLFKLEGFTKVFNLSSFWFLRTRFFLYNKLKLSSIELFKRLKFKAIVRK